MAGFILERLTDESIILGTTLDSWNSDVDIPEWAAQLYQMLNEVSEPIIYIGDLRQGKPWTVDQLIKTASAVARGIKPIFHHPNLKEALIITQNTLLEFGAKGLQAEVFGRVRIKVFNTLEEALDYARSPKTQ